MVGKATRGRLLNELNCMERCCIRQIKIETGIEKMMLETCWKQQKTKEE